MTTQQIIEELKRLPVTDVLHVIEAAVEQVRAELGVASTTRTQLSLKEQLAKAADALWQDYTADAELRAFSVLDGEKFVHAEG